MTPHDKLKIKYARLLGEYTGTLKGVCAWELPKQLKIDLEVKIKELEEIKTE